MTLNIALPRLSLVVMGFLLPMLAHSNSIYSFTSFDAPSGFDELRVSGINNAGEVVGYVRCLSDTCGGSGKIEPFLYFAGQLSVFTVPIASGDAFAGGINNLGQIVGFYSPLFGQPLVGFLDSGGVSRTIPNPTFQNGNTHDWGINDQGQIVGDYTLNGSVGFVLSGGTYTTLSFLPHGINDAGVIVGDGWIYQNGIYTAVNPSLQSINNSGVAVGANQIYADGQYTSLDFPGPYTTFMTGINDYGVISGMYEDTTGAHTTYGFIATPIPEPRTCWLLISTLLPLLTVLRKRRTAGRRPALRRPWTLKSIR